MLGLVGAVGEFTPVKWLAKRAGGGVDAGDNDRCRGAESRAERDLAVDIDIEAGVGRVGRRPCLFDRGVDVAGCGIKQRFRHVDIGSVAGVVGILNGEPIEREILCLDANVAVLAWFNGDRRSAFDRTRHRGLAVDDSVFAKEVHLPRRAHGRHCAPPRVVGSGGDIVWFISICRTVA